jgi:hypothetical protein
MPVSGLHRYCLLSLLALAGAGLFPACQSSQQIDGFRGPSLLLGGKLN